MITKTDASKKKKYEILKLWREMVFAINAENFEKKLEEWNRAINCVMLHVGKREDNNVIPLSDYYDKNWGSIQAMWARFERRKLPIGDEHTTNRLERAFGVLKAELKVKNTKVLITSVITSL